MHLAPAEEIQRRHKKSQEQLSQICRGLMKSELQIKEATDQYLAFWKVQWTWIESINQHDPGAILSFFRSIITTPEIPDNLLINSLFAYRSLHAAYLEGTLVRTPSKTTLEPLYHFLKESRLAGKLTDFEQDLLNRQPSIRGVTLASWYLGTSSLSPDSLRQLLSHALDRNGREDFIALLSWPEWTGRFDRKEYLPLIWPKSLEGSVNEPYFKKFPKKYREGILADKRLRDRMLKKDFLSKIRSNALSVRDTPEYRFSELSVRRFVRHPLRTLQDTTLQKTESSLLKVLWNADVLGKIKPHARRFWSSPWIYKSRPLPARLCSSPLMAQLPGDVSAMLAFLGAKTPMDRLKVLCTALGEAKSLPETALLHQEIAGMVQGLPPLPKYHDLLITLSEASPPLWSRIFEFLSSAHLQSWCGQSDSGLLRWIFSGGPCPRPYLIPFKNEIWKGLERGAIRIKDDISDFLEEIDLEKLPGNTTLHSGLSLALRDTPPSAAEWIRKTWRDQQRNDSVRPALSKLFLNMPAKLQNALLRQLPDERSWLRCFAETGLLKKEYATRADGILRQKIRGKHRTVARQLLVFLEKNRQDKDLAKFKQSLLPILLSDREGFIAELARFYPSEVGAVLWETDKLTLLLAACGSSRTVDWISKRIPHEQLEEAFDEISTSLSTRPTLSAALEVASRAGIRELPQLVRLAFQRWKSDPKQNRGRVFDNLYHSWPLPKKSGGTRTITAPSPSLKRLQRRILDRVLASVPINDCVHGFIGGRSCATNARNHTGKQVVAKLDISSFFPSTPYHLIVKALSTATGGKLSQGALFLLADICSYQGGLPIGAPTSPTLGNIILSRFDEVLVERCTNAEVTYTRYADDLVFSGDNRAVPMLGVAKGMLSKLGYSIDPKKELIMRRGMRQTVTGLVVNQEVNLPRRQRRRLRAALHAMKDGRGTHWHGKPADHARIIGLLGFHRGVNPESAARLSSKYLPSNGKETSS